MYVGGICGLLARLVRFVLEAALLSPVLLGACCAIRLNPRLLQGSPTQPSILPVRILTGPWPFLSFDFLALNGNWLCPLAHPDLLFHLDSRLINASSLMCHSPADMQIYYQS